MKETTFKSNFKGKGYYALWIDDDKRKIVYCKGYLDLNLQIRLLSNDGVYFLTDITYYGKDNYLEKDMKMWNYKNKICFNKYKHFLK